MGSSSTYAYDTLGDLTTTATGSATTSYGFNQAGQMASTSTNNTSYLYTGDGLEAGTAVPGWGAASGIDGTKVIDSVSCASTTFCEAVDANGNGLKFSGTTWSAASSIDGAKVIDSVSCPTSSFCMAVDANGNAMKYTGSWAAASSIDGTNSINSVSCVSSTFCMAVDANGNAMKYTGSWAAASSIDGTHSIGSVSCKSSTFCEAVDASGNALKYNGTSWSSASDIDGTHGLKSVSCPATTFCAAVDGSGNVLTFNGTSWSSATDIDGTSALKSISCTSGSFCAVLAAAGNALIFNGTTWSAAANIDGTNALNSVSCTSTTSCVAVDNAGNALSYRAGATPTSQLVWDANGSLALTLSDGSNDYIYGPNNEPVEQISLSSSTPTYLTYTPSDSSWLATNNAGQQVAFWRYDAFGNLATGTPDSPFGYSGQYTDASTGLVNDRARFYESQTGSFTTRDPDFSSTDQAYAYASQDPVNGSDPSGQWPCVSASCLEHDAGEAVASAATFGTSTVAQGVINSVETYDACRNNDYSIYTCANSTFNPAYRLVASAVKTYQDWGNPCTSNWTVAGDALQTTVALGSTVAVAAGVEAAGSAVADGIGSLGPLGDEGSITPPFSTPWGWSGSASYRAAVNVVEQGGDDRGHIRYDPYASPSRAANRGRWWIH